MKRILLVEDDPERAREIEACVPEGIRCVWTESAGAALGVLRLDRFDAVLLDYDLYKSRLGNPQFTGESVAVAICETQDRSCLVFVHSQNASGGRLVVRLLTEAGFSVDHHPWSDETRVKLRTWLEELLPPE